MYLSFKLKVIKFEEKHNNRTADWHFGPASLEVTISHWRMQEKKLQFFKLDTHLFFFSGFTKWSDTESDVKNWITTTEETGFLCL